MTYLVCRDCGRALRSEEARQTGYGRVCARKHKPPTPAPRRGIRRRSSTRPAPVPAAPDELPGQDALPMFYLQPTLESL